MINNNYHCIHKIIAGFQLVIGFQIFQPLLLTLLSTSSSKMEVEVRDNNCDHPIRHPRAFHNLRSLPSKLKSTKSPYHLTKDSLHHQRSHTQDPPTTWDKTLKTNDFTHDQAKTSCVNKCPSSKICQIDQDLETPTVDPLFLNNSNSNTNLNWERINKTETNKLKTFSSRILGSINTLARISLGHYRLLREIIPKLIPIDQQWINKRGILSTLIIKSIISQMLIMMCNIIRKLGIQ